MELYLVQHGEATSEAENPERPLAQQGRHNVTRVGATAARLGLRPGEIRHSGKRRAAETAEILADALGLRSHLVAGSGMAPNDDPQPVASALANATGPVMLVGHLPFLSRLASLLLTGDPGRTVIRFRNAAIVCLVREDEVGSAWSVAWVLTPEMALSPA